MRSAQCKGSTGVCHQCTYKCWCTAFLWLAICQTSWQQEVEKQGPACYSCAGSNACVRPCMTCQLVTHALPSDATAHTCKDACHLHDGVDHARANIDVHISCLMALPTPTPARYLIKAYWYLCTAAWPGITVVNALGAVLRFRSTTLHFHCA